MEKETVASAKYKQLVRTARDLFMRYGVKRISVEEICRKAHISKMTFYKYFKNKLDITDFILKEIIREGRVKFDRILRTEAPYSEKVRQMIALKIEQNKKFGDEFFQDVLHYLKDDIGNLFLAEQENIMHVFVDSLIEAQKSGEIRQNMNPKFIFYILNQMITISDDPQLIHLYPDHTQRVAALTHFFFYGIMPERRHTDK